MSIDLDYDYFFGNESAQRKIAHKLNFDYSLGSQDWEYEVSHLRKTEDYIELYNAVDTTDEEKSTLMEMIFDSIEHNNDYDGKKTDFEKYRNFINNSIKENLEIHKGTLVYWIQSDFLISEKLLEIILVLGFKNKIKWRLE